jgi:hypothetical protein
MGELDSVNTLIFTIVKHFVGTPSNITTRISDYLNNLRCFTMSDYRWYQDIFHSRVMLRLDSQKPYWKEKFIDGLPSLFAHEVKDELILVKFHFASKFEIDVSHRSVNLISTKTKHLNFLQQEVKYKRISEQLADKLLQSKISAFNNKIVYTVCSDLPNAFWHRKKHIVSLPYVKDFSEKRIPTKAQPILMNVELLDFCQKEISDLLVKGIIRKSKSPWSCAAFYVRKNVEIERGVPRLVINYKPLNDVLE